MPVPSEVHAPLHLYATIHFLASWQYTRSCGPELYHPTAAMEVWRGILSVLSSPVLYPC